MDRRLILNLVLVMETSKLGAVADPNAMASSLRCTGHYTCFLAEKPKTWPYGAPELLATADEVIE